MPNDQILITLQEAQERGYGSVSTLRRRIRDGVLPATKLQGQKYRVRVSDLEALAAPVTRGENESAEASTSHLEHE